MMSTFTGTREQARPRMMGRHPGQVSYPSKEYVMCVNEGVKASAVSSLSGGLPIMREPAQAGAQCKAALCLSHTNPKKIT